MFLRGTALEDRALSRCRNIRSPAWD